MSFFSFHFSFFKDKVLCSPNQPQTTLVVAGLFGGGRPSQHTQHCRVAVRSPDSPHLKGCKEGQGCWVPEP